MQGHVKVAPARWWHVPGLSRLIRETRRHRSAGATVLWAPQWSPSLGLLQSVWAVPMPGMVGPRSFVAEIESRPVGLAQMRPRREPHQWEVVYLAVEQPPGAGSSVEADEVAPGSAWLRSVPDRRATRLLGELCDAGMALGAERIFASITDEGGRFELFKQVGFSPVVREYGYFRAREAKAGVATPRRHAAQRVAGIAGLRPQRRADAFGLLQLYQECTPKVVQMAEGKRSRSWDLPANGLGRRVLPPGWASQRGAERWVVERDARKVAWLHLTRRRRGHHLVQLLVDQRASDLNEPLLRFAMAQLEADPAPGIMVNVREHQHGIVAALEGLGFSRVETRLLMVKQLAIMVRHQFVPALEKVV
jgi:hypothetical protein